MATRNRRAVIAALDEESAAYSAVRELIPGLADHPAAAPALLTRELAAGERYELELENRRRIDRTTSDELAPAPGGDEW